MHMESGLGRWVRGVGGIGHPLSWVQPHRSTGRTERTRGRSGDASELRASSFALVVFSHTCGWLETPKGALVESALGLLWKCRLTASSWQL